MQNDHAKIKNYSFENDLVSDGITIGVGSASEFTNPDYKGSITNDKFDEAPNQSSDAKDTLKEANDNQNVAQVRPVEVTHSNIEATTPQYQQNNISKAQSNEWSKEITISRDGIDLKDVAKIEKDADKMLNHGDAAGVVDTIRGSVPYILKNTFGNDAIWKETDTTFGEPK